MIPAYRKRHLTIWILLALLLPALFVMAFQAQKGEITSDIQIGPRTSPKKVVKTIDGKEWGTFDVKFFSDHKNTADTLDFYFVETKFENNDHLPSAWIKVKSVEGKEFFLGQLTKKGGQVFGLPPTYSPTEKWELSIIDIIKEESLFTTEF